jgi:uncharacterized protein with FMN-binding domain
MRSLLFLILLAAQAAPPAKAPADPAARKTRTRKDVEALIAQAGRTPPDWFAATKLNFPQSLDLSWPPNPGGPWDANKNIGQFIWSTINENPARWQEGIRFLHHLLTVNKDKPDVVKRTMSALGLMYHNLHEDYARAAFWWRKAGDADTDELADCYWKLGCKEMAVEILNKIGSDNTRNCTVIKLWSDVGDLTRALKLAEARGADDSAAMLAAGDACRLAGKYDDAVKYYDKVLAVQSNDRDNPRNKNRAKASLDAIRLFDALDVKKVAPGTYTANSLGYEAPVDVEVIVAGGKLTSCRVTQHHEKQFYSSISDTPARLIAKQSVKGVEATSGATITSEAIINATAKALSQGMPRKK